MGESIFEGTITKWLKKAGESVQKDEPLFEISTDKVDAEIPAPESGVLSQILVAEGETVTVNTVVAVIGGPSAVTQGDGAPSAAAEARPELRAAAELPEAAVGEPEISPDEIRSSPLVRRMAREHNLDLSRIQGTGSNGRITKEDVLRHLAAGPAATETATSAAPAARPAAPALEDKLEPMSRMRSIIAQRMAESRRTIPHAYLVYKVDMTRVARLRDRQRAAFEQRHGVKLTYMPFIAAAAIEALRRFPVLNASAEGDAIRYHGSIHLGVAVALEWGLIVPVVKEAERRSFSDLARTMADLAERARTKKLKPEEAIGSTFTLTNPGVFGGEFGTPIINPPESAILAIGGMKKEPAVLTDAEGSDTIGIRSMTHFCLGFDHRIIDGADAGRFMTAFKDALEGWTTEIG
jgi:2-oxoglutarate dehydrogenase E2 component (dihydrolipoamide succinyltransferase)